MQQILILDEKYKRFRIIKQHNEISLPSQSVACVPSPRRAMPGPSIKYIITGVLQIVDQRRQQRVTSAGAAASREPRKKMPSSSPDRPPARRQRSKDSVAQLIKWKVCGSSLTRSYESCLAAAAQTCEEYCYHYYFCYHRISITARCTEKTSFGVNTVLVVTKVALRISHRIA